METDLERFRVRMAMIAGRWLSLRAELAIARDREASEYYRVSLERDIVTLVAELDQAVVAYVTAGGADGRSSTGSDREA